MGIHARKPWRQVVHIKHDKGRNGGEYWVLTLSCDHVATRPIPQFKIWRLFHWESCTAPERVRCLFCDDVSGSRE